MHLTDTERERFAEWLRAKASEYHKMAVTEDPQNLGWGWWYVGNARVYEAIARQLRQEAEHGQS